MSPHTTAQRVLAELKSRLSIETDPLTRELLTDKIKSVSQTLIRESVRISLSRDLSSRSFGLTQSVPIKCGLRGSTGHALPDKQRHWYWDNVSDKEARKLERLATKMEKFLFVRPEKTLIRKFQLLGGLKQTLIQIGLGAILSLPESVRQNKAKDIIKLIEEKINGQEKLPFC